MIKYNTIDLDINPRFPNNDKHLLNVKYNTIDLDINPRFPNNDKHLLNDILTKISLCESCIKITWTDSQSKGYHLFFYCSKDCDLCRFVFDDTKRYMLDIKRPDWRQNIMFDVKGVPIA